MIKAWSYIEEYKVLRKKILKSIDRVLKSGQIFFGNELKKFEKRFVKENNLKYLKFQKFPNFLRFRKFRDIFLRDEKIICFRKNIY